MMSLVVVAILVGAALGCLIRLGFARSLRPFVAASLLIGAAGYVLQGSPMLPSSPARSPAGRILGATRLAIFALQRGHGT